MSQGDAAGDILSAAPLPGLHFKIPALLFAGWSGGRTETRWGHSLKQREAMQRTTVPTMDAPFRASDKRGLRLEYKCPAECRHLAPRHVTNAPPSLPSLRTEPTIRVGASWLHSGICKVTVLGSRQRLRLTRAAVQLAGTRHHLRLLSRSPDRCSPIDCLKVFFF